MGEDEEGEGEKERERERERTCVCVCVCVCARARACVRGYVRACVLVCVYYTRVSVRETWACRHIPRGFNRKTGTDRLTFFVGDCSSCKSKRNSLWQLSS